MADRHKRGDRMHYRNVRVDESTLVWRELGGKEEQVGKDFFSEEKKQKTFVSCVQQPFQIGGFGC